jgi:hypothetical protein
VTNFSRDMSSKECYHVTCLPKITLATEEKLKRSRGHTKTGKRGGLGRGQGSSDGQGGSSREWEKSNFLCIFKIRGKQDVMINLQLRHARIKVKNNS